MKTLAEQCTEAAVQMQTHCEILAEELKNVSHQFTDPAVLGVLNSLRSSLFGIRADARMIVATVHATRVTGGLREPAPSHPHQPQPDELQLA